MVEFNRSNVVTTKGVAVNSLYINILWSDPTENSPQGGETLKLQFPPPIRKSPIHEAPSLFTGPIRLEALLKAWSCSIHCLCYPYPRCLTGKYFCTTGSTKFQLASRLHPFNFRKLWIWLLQKKRRLNFEYSKNHKLNN